MRTLFIVYLFRYGKSGKQCKGRRGEAGVLILAQMRMHCCKNISSRCFSKYSWMLHGWADEKVATHCLLPRRNFHVFKVYCLGTQTRKRLENIRSQWLFIVSQMLLSLRLHATYIEDTTSASWKQNMFLKFSKNVFCVLDLILLPQNFSWFALAFTEAIEDEAIIQEPQFKGG